MARITVEDTVGKVKDRFELVVLSAFRAKDIYAGNKALVERNDNKNPVIAIREIEDDKTSAEFLRDSLVSNYQELSVGSSDVVQESADDADVLEEIKKELMVDTEEDAQDVEKDAEAVAASAGVQIEE